MDYQILQDREGFYIADRDGFDLCRTYRFAWHKNALAKLHKWLEEDEDATREDFGN